MYTGFESREYMLENSSEVNLQPFLVLTTNENVDVNVMFTEFTYLATIIL